MSSKKLSRRDLLKYTGYALGATAAGPLISSAADAATDTLKIGAITSLSGADVFGGNLTRRGYDFWAETVNKQGGVKIGDRRFHVQMLYGDDQSKPATGVDAAIRLIRQKQVDVLFGPYTSGVQEAVDPICTKFQMPMIAGSAESPAVWSSKPAYSFGILPSVDVTAGNALGMVFDTATPRPQTLAVVGANEPFSKQTAEGFKAYADGNPEVKLLDYSLFPPEADLTPVISRLKSQNPDVVAVGAHEGKLIEFVKTAKSLDFKPKALIMHYGVTASDFAGQLGADANGVLGITDWLPSMPYSDDTFGSAKDYYNNFYNRWGSHPDYTAAGCSASGVVLQDALARLGKTPPLSTADRAALKDALEKTDITCFDGPVRFATSGEHFHDNVNANPILIQIQGGDVTAVAPKKSSEGSIEYPLKSSS